MEKMIPLKFHAIMWGILLMLLGGSLLLPAFGITFPFFRLMLLLVFLYLGICLVLGLQGRLTPRRYQGIRDMPIPEAPEESSDQDKKE